MDKREMIVWMAAMVCASLAVAWLVERRHILTLREELETWNRNATQEGAA